MPAGEERDGVTCEHLRESAAHVVGPLPAVDLSGFCGRLDVMAGLAELGGGAVERGVVEIPRVYAVVR